MSDSSPVESQPTSQEVTSPSNRQNAKTAIELFQAVLRQLDDERTKEAFIKLVVARGFRESQVLPRIDPESATAPSEVISDKPSNE
jgi:methyltransferase-like protein